MAQATFQGGNKSIPDYGFFRLKNNEDRIFKATPQGVEQYNLRYQPDTYKHAVYPLSNSIFQSLPVYDADTLSQGDIPRLRTISRTAVTPQNVSDISNLISNTGTQAAPSYTDPMLGKGGGEGLPLVMAPYNYGADKTTPTAQTNQVPASVLQNAISYFNKFPGTTDFGTYHKNPDGSITDISASGGGKVVGNVSMGTTGGAGTGTTTPAPVLAPPPEKSAFKNSAAYKALSVDVQALVDLAFSTFTGTPEQQQIFANALIQAQALADPYAKAQLALSLGEFQSKIAFVQGD
ncbi:MAG: hypothetical protein AAB649_07305, partial [Patescibacteria group bacterium]